MYINMACYSLGSTVSTWYKANTTCNSLGTGVHLATISSATENNAIKAYYGTSISMWIGLNCIATHASSGTAGEVWVWADGSTSAYRDWSSGEPSNQFGTEACVHLYASANGAWNDLTCTISYIGPPYIYGLCKFTPGMDVGG